MGPVTTKRLIGAFGTSQNVFEANPSALGAVKGVLPAVIDQIVSRSTLARAEAELAFVEENQIRVLLITDPSYPTRLRQCPDAPTLLYLKGNFNPNEKRMLGVVGTRNATSRGKEVCTEIISDLANQDVTIVSGMAYGIDYCAHKAAIENAMPTAAVFAHGLDIVYPSAHRKTAEQMLALGGWITEFESATPMDRNFFPRRNRIVAGLCDGVLVIESDRKGGSLITADIANSYSREVMAVPGRPTDPRSKGCNWLIKTNRAAMVESAADIQKLMNWEAKARTPQPVQLNVFPDLSEEELELARCLQQSGPVSIDSLADIAGRPVREVSHLLLNLEMEGLVRALPGKRYRLLKPLGSY